jgi:hypothetical protein
MIHRGGCRCIGRSVARSIAMVSVVDRYVIARESNIVRVDFNREPDPPAPCFPGANGRRLDDGARESADTPIADLPLLCHGWWIKARSKATPAPGRMPSSTAARVRELPISATERRQVRPASR